MAYVKRHAIIIGYPGAKGRFLPGVACDIYNMYGFLQTPRGGGWLPEEITVLQSATKAQIIAAVQGIEADYLLVYFSGHGAGQPELSWEGGRQCVVVRRWLQVSAAEFICDLDLLNHRVPRQQIICDCCRSRPGSKISGIPETLEDIAFTNEEFYAARAVLDGWISSSQVGRVIAHSTLDGQPAIDSEEGGKFTLALLEGSLYWQTGTPYSPIGIDNLVDYAVAVLRSGGKSQVPQIVYRTGRMTVPFALDTPWPFLAHIPVVMPEGQERTALAQEYSARRPINGWLALGGVALGLWVFSGFK